MNTLFVWNVPEGIGTDDLKCVFCQFGELVDARFARGRKYAVVTYFERRDARRAVESRNLCVNGHSLKAKMFRWPVT